MDSDMSVVSTVIIMLSIMGVIGLIIPFLLLLRDGSRLNANKIMLWIAMVFAMTITFGVLADFSQLGENVRIEVIKYAAILTIAFGAFLGVEQIILSAKSESNVDVSFLNGLIKLKHKTNEGTNTNAITGNDDSGNRCNDNGDGDSGG